MKEFGKYLRRYPIVFVFLAFLMGFAVLDELWPKRDFSELENRSLAQRPPFSLGSVLEKDTTKTWMSKYNEYTKDQVAFRDGWINLKSGVETALLKTENNGVWYGSDHYLFAKQLEIGGKFTMNAGALQKLAERHPGQVDVMIVPSASLVLEDRLPAHLPAADEAACLDELARLLDGSATVYDMRETLAAHKDEDIYYRTDHHWTFEGAYLAYQAYVTAKGMTPMDLSAHEIKTVEDFYGTNYSKARRPGTPPDTLRYLELPNVLRVYKLQRDGTMLEETGPVMDTADLATRDKYKAFLRGNNGYSVLTGDGEGSILVVKDSYANSFLPFLTANYKTIGIVDFRDNANKLDAILEEGGYDQVLVLYSFSGFSTDISLASRIATP